MAQKVTAMDIRAATALAGQIENVSAFCRSQQISRETFYKWRRRFGEQGLAGLEERSRRPHHSPIGSAFLFLICIPPAPSTS